MESDLRSRLLDYLNAEYSASADSELYLKLVSEEGLENKGICLTNLTVNNIEMKGIEQLTTFSHSRNLSRFRTGDDVLISRADFFAEGVVFVSKIDSITIITKPSKYFIPNQSGWVIKVKPVSFYTSLRNAVERFEPGKPGWGFLAYILNAKKIPKPLFPPKIKIDNSYYKDIVTTSLHGDENKTTILAECLKLPPLLAIQGPPGTGKTFLLALIAELLISAKVRVAIVAFTHQAVNNALNALHSINKNRELVKIGDELRNESLDNNITQLSFRSFRKFYSERDPNAAPPLIGLTFHSALSNLGVRSNEFIPQVILIDEAGQLSLLFGSLIGLFGAGSLLFFGDDAQMPPIFHSDLKNHELATSVFSRIRQLDPSMVKFIDTTFRLNKHLCSVISKSFYETEDSEVRLLKSSAAASAKVFSLPNRISSDCELIDILGEESFVWVDTGDSGSTQLNLTESQLCVQLIHACLSSGIAADNIAVVTPFRKQAANIISGLFTLGYSADSLPIVDTVERVQGLTVEIIIISMVSSDPEYIKSQGEFLLSPNRMNVAISRARTKAVLLMSQAFFECIPNEYKSIVSQHKFRRLVNSAKQIRLQKIV